MLLYLIHIHNRESSSHWSIHHHVPSAIFAVYFQDYDLSIENGTESLPWIYRSISSFLKYKLANIDCCSTLLFSKDKSVLGIYFVTVEFLMTRSVCHIPSKAQFHHYSAVLWLNQCWVIIDCSFGLQPLVFFWIRYTH